MTFKDIAEYEEKDSELAKYTISELHKRIDKAIEYIEKMEKLHFDYSYEKQELLKILKGE